MKRWSKLRLAGAVAAFGGGTLLAVAAFLPWLTLDGRALGISRTATGNALDFALAAVGASLAVVGVLAFADLLRGHGRRTTLLWALPTVLVAGGAILLLVQLIAGHDVGSGATVHRRFGIWLGTGAAWVAVSGVTVGSLATRRLPGPTPPPPG